MHRKILFFAQHASKDGHIHYGIDEYDVSTGLITRFSDYFFN